VLEAFVGAVVIGFTAITLFKLKFSLGSPFQLAPVANEIAF
jgi:hypothetical protein